MVSASTVSGSAVSNAVRFSSPVTGAAFAHQSFAMFDRDKEVVLTGVVHEFQWTNPHAFIEFDGANDKGPPERWSVEMNSPNNLVHAG